MPTLQVTDQQVVEMFKQLPPEQAQAVFELLLAQWWPHWADGSSYAEERARVTAAARGRDWRTMTEAEREDFVDELVHEDRRCR